MIHFPKTSAEVVSLKGEIRAGGTDLMERRHLGISRGDLIDVRDVPDLDRVTPITTGPLAGGRRVGARSILANLARDPDLLKNYKSLAHTAGGLATPEIRAVATLGGSLTQRVRCWYYRNSEFDCLKKGGSTCFARQGDHLYHSCFDLGPCVAPHPSSMGLALLAYDAQVVVEGGTGRGMAEFFGDGTDPRRENRLEPGALITAIDLPVPWEGERTAYFRSISRARAEWPLVEVVVRLKGVEVVTDVRVVVGGVANIPLRLLQVEQAIIGKPFDSKYFEDAVALSGQGARPLPMTTYKVELLPPTVLETLERALKGGVS